MCKYNTNATGPDGKRNAYILKPSPEKIRNYYNILYVNGYGQQNSKTNNFNCRQIRTGERERERERERE